MRVLPVVTSGIRGLGVLFLATFMMTGRAQAQNQDLTFSLGGIPGQTRNFQGSAGTAQISADRSLGVNYGHRFLEAKNAALFGEVEFVALPNRPVTSTTATVPRSYASLYVTPGLRLKLFPNSRLSPWGAIGGGYALYEESAQLSNGQKAAARFLNRGVFTYGGGLDYRLFHFIGLRAEIRDFFSGNPNLNVVLSSSTQHNIVASGGVVLHF